MTARLRILVVLTSCFVGLALSASATAVTTLQAKTGPGFDISLKTTAGKKVTRLPAGTYRIVVSDRNGFDNPQTSGFAVRELTVRPASPSPAGVFGRWRCAPAGTGSYATRMSSR